MSPTPEIISIALQILKDVEKHNVQVCMDEFAKPGQHAIAPEVMVERMLNAVFKEIKIKEMKDK